MGWKQYVRAVAAEQRREQRAAARAYRDLERTRKQQAKAAALEHAQYEASRYENYVALLTSLHLDCGPRWDWQMISQAPPPPAPVKDTQQELAAHLALSEFNPGFFGRLFGGAAKQRRLETALAEARALEERVHQQNLAEHGKAVRLWQEHVRLAPGVLRLDYMACRDALACVSAFAELESFQSVVSLAKLQANVATLICNMNDPDLIPREEVKLTAAGRLSTKEMAIGKYWLLLQDHVCSCAIHVARETFAVLPIGRVIVNMVLRQLNSATGHIEPMCVLAVHFTPDGLSRLRFDSLDPSDSMKNFHHRMKFKKGSGFEQVELSDHEENWVTT